MMKKFIEESGLSIKEFSEKYGIPYNTVRQWYNGARSAPDWLVNLFKAEQAYKPLIDDKSIKSDFPINQINRYGWGSVNYFVQWNHDCMEFVVGFTRYIDVARFVREYILKNNYRFRIMTTPISSQEELKF